MSEYINDPELGKIEVVDDLATPEQIAANDEAIAEKIHIAVTAEPSV